MSFPRIVRPIAVAILVALGVAGTVGSAEALTGLHSQHGPCQQQSKDPHGPACPSPRR